MIAADEAAPPLNRTTMSFVSAVCKRKGCVGSSDPDLSLLFEFAQLKQGPKMGVAPFWVLSLWREKTQCARKRVVHSGFHCNSSRWFYPIEVFHMGLPEQSLPSFVLGSDLTSVTVEQTQSCIDPEPT